MSDLKSFDVEQAMAEIKNIENKYKELLCVRDNELSLKKSENEELRKALEEVQTLVKLYRKQNDEKIIKLQSENEKMCNMIENYEKLLKEDKKMGFNGKLKAVTFSYDDGITQDRRLIKLLNKYGLKCTFNINSGRFLKAGPISVSGVIVPHVCVKKEEVKGIYEGHEIAVHTVTHPNLALLSDEEIIREVEDDRIALSEIAGYEVVGMAYPGGTPSMNDHVAKVIAENTGVKYARTTTPTFNFEPQTDLFAFNPTLHQHMDMDRMFQMAKDFIRSEVDSPKIFYIWGHAYELDARDDWDKLEKFFELISGHDDIFYGTNKEILL